MATANAADAAATHDQTRAADHVRETGLPAWAARLLSMTSLVGVIGFAVAEIVQVGVQGTAGLEQASLLNALTWLVGVNVIITASGHLLMPDRVAASIGWPAGNPFQWEVGLGTLGIGVLGVMSSSFGPDFWLAAVVAFGVFYLGAAAGHVREMIQERNFNPGNAGVIFWYDLIVPLVVIALYVAR